MTKATKSTGFKCGILSTLAMLIVVTAVTAMACGMEASAAKQVPPQANYETLEEFNYFFADSGRVGEKGEMIFDFSNIEFLEIDPKCL